MYRDQELPSPWKEKMEAHLAVCPECRTRLEQYRALSRGGACPDTAAEAAQQRVWRNLSPRFQEGPREVRLREEARSPLWRRSVSLPLPVAAAAAAVILALAMMLTGRLSGPALQEPAVADGRGLDVQGFIPVSGMNDILQYLNNGGADDMVIIHLPESRRFTVSGEPVIVKEADYQARRASN
ncbi:MAG: hypothetical protein LBU28_04730 [Spirochaetaceae bacterium]|nr:hypothetical protein [Spirochaetaceae bacterium]